MIVDKSGALDRSIQVVINDREHVKPQDFEKILIRDGGYLHDAHCRWLDKKRRRTICEG